LVRRLCSGTSSRKLEDCSLRSVRFITPPRGSRMKAVEPRRRVAIRGLSPKAVQLSCHIASATSSFGKCLIEREFWRGRHTQGHPVPADRCQQTSPRVSRLASLICQGCHENERRVFPLRVSAGERQGRAAFLRPVLRKGRFATDPDFLYAARSRTGCAAFSEESRMRFVNATRVHRKSGGSLCKCQK
jgi:hypothetical protein